MAGDEWQIARARATLSSADRLKATGQDWPNVYFLAGLAVELALWAIRLRGAGLVECDHQNVRPQHDLSALALLANLREAIRCECNSNRGFQQNWRTVCDWDSNARFEKVTRQDAVDLMVAVNNPNNGVMAWLEKHFQAMK